MNFVGHIHIAGHCLERNEHGAGHPSVPHPDRYLFGAALPDFATIGRFQLTGPPADPALAAGVDMHHATDNAFHGSDWFVTHSQAVRTNLESRGINRGAARAVGHVGVELLLDGHLLARHDDLRPRAQHVLGLADDDQLDLAELVAGDRQTDWVDHLSRISSWPLPGDYHRPLAVAERLHRILRPRRRLAFGPDDIAVVANTLTDHLDDLVAGIGDMVASLADELVDAHA
ncbi:MAG: hypothetical protein OES24_23660 [Acidimicrobiia bacterium]|nr:hypothetical protein [Acidimicrobiia bacterium]